MSNIDRAAAIVGRYANQDTTGGGADMRTVLRLIGHPKVGAAE